MTKILIADDELMLRAVVVEMLEDAGFTVYQAADGREAMSVLKLHPSIQLLISDVQMPEMDGWALADAALKLNPDLRVLLITGYAPPPRRGLERRYEILPKPFNLEALCARARQITSESPRAMPLGRARDPQLRL